MFRTLFVASALLFAAPSLAADDYKVDDSHTSILFSIHHFNAAWVYGRFNKVDGDFTWDADPKNIKFVVKIDAASVDTNNEKRDKHLRGSDFFTVEEFPTIDFVSKKVVKDGDAFKVTADVTMHGVTKEVTVDLKHTGEGPDPWGGYRLGLLSEFTLKRSEFGITHMLEGLSDEVRITVAIEGKKKIL